MKNLKQILKNNPCEVFKIVAQTAEILQMNPHIYNNLDEASERVGLENFVYMVLYDRKSLKEPTKEPDIEISEDQIQIKIEKPCLN